MDLQDAQDLLQAEGFYNLSSDDAHPNEDRFQVVDRNWVVVSQRPGPCAEVNTSREIVLGVLKDDEDAASLGVGVQQAPSSCAAGSAGLLGLAEDIGAEVQFASGPEDRSDRPADFVNPDIQTGWVAATTSGGIVDIERYESDEARRIAELDVSIENEQRSLGNTWVGCGDVLVVFSSYLDAQAAFSDAIAAQGVLERELGPC